MSSAWTSIRPLVVPHTILLSKLERYGFWLPAYMLESLSDYSCSRGGYGTVSRLPRFQGAASTSFYPLPVALLPAQRPSCPC